MKFHPILFSTEMVKAILEGRKTMTRRVVKPQPDPESDGIDYMPCAPSLEWEQYYNEIWKPWKWDTAEGESISSFCPYGEVGDVLWVRESFTQRNGSVGFSKYVYKAGTIDKKIKFKPSIHMPKAACRIFLEIISIRVERLQEINHHAAIFEGVEYRHIKDQGLGYKVYGCGTNDQQTASPVFSFKTLWQTINGEESWQSNPWVWVIGFRRINKPSTFLTK